MLLANDDLKLHLAKVAPDIFETDILELCYAQSLEVTKVGHAYGMFLGIEAQWQNLTCSLVYCLDAGIFLLHFGPGESHYVFTWQDVLLVMQTKIPTC